MPRKAVIGRVKCNTFAVMDDAVEAGVRTGVVRAFKHRDDRPTDEAEEALIEHCQREVMSAICEKFSFE